MEIGIERNERGYGYLELMSGSHDHKRTRVWVRNELIEPGPEENDEIRPFPVRDAWVYTTQKGSFVLRPRVGGVVYLVEVVSGYRGTAQIEKCAAPAGECIVVAAGHKYHSGQGALGETAWALVNSDGPIEVYARRTGRRIDQPEHAFRLTPDGEREELIEDAEICDLLDTEKKEEGKCQ